MKNFKIAALTAVVSAGALFTSCGSGLNTNVSLNNDVDSLSYAYGATFYEFQLKSQLSQMGITTDTMMLATNYNMMIGSEEDATKKAALIKEKKQKLDSVSSANERNISAFFKGFQEGMNAVEAKEAHIIGTAIGNQIAKQMLPAVVQQAYSQDATVKDNFSQQLFLTGMLAKMKGETTVITEPEKYVEKVMMAAQQKAMGAQQKAMEDERQGNPEMQQMIAANKAAGEAFLVANKAKSGVVTLDNGMQYKVLKAGNGPKPTSSDVVSVHYHGTLIDGTVFDSSVQRGEPATFGVTQVIKGWIEILQLMPVGSKWQVYIPSDLAYGDVDRGGPIAPGSTLIFDIELLDIQK